MEQDAHQSVLVPLDEGLEGPDDITADLDHEPDVRVPRLQLLFQISASRPTGKSSREGLLDQCFMQSESIELLRSMVAALR